MAKTSFLEIPTGLEDVYFKTLQSGDRYIYPRVRSKNSFFSRQKVISLSQRSFLPQLKLYWDILTTEEKALWKTYDPHPHKNGWRQFVGEMSARIKAGESGVSDPNEFHNGKVGVISIESPATSIKLEQPHPSDYYILKRVTGKQSMYQPVLVEEPFYLPLQIAINYKADLTSQGDGAYAKFWAEIHYLYQGLDKYYNLECNLDLSADWQSASATVSVLKTSAVSYNLFLEVFNCRGTLQFDNLRAIHGGVNWVRDPYCLNIATGFTKAFYQVPEHWAPVDLPDGAGFGSLYAF